MNVTAHSVQVTTAWLKGSNLCKFELCVVLTPASIMQSWVRIPIKGQTFLRPTR